MISRIGFVVMALMSGAFAGPAVAQVSEPQPGSPASLLNQGLNSIDENYRGMHSDLPSGPIGHFIDLWTSGAIEQAMSMKDEVCDAWRRRPSGVPLTGEASVLGVGISLEEMCATWP